MEKVKVTKEQEKGLKNIKIPHLAVMEHVNYCDVGHGLNNLTLDELIKALYIGYEIEPEFNVEVGDWIKDTSTGALVEIINEQHRNNIMDERYTTKRHATPEEIKQEKERRWWAKHGRDVWELKQGDVLYDKQHKHVFVVDRVAKFEDGIHVVYQDKNWDYLANVRDEDKVACFVENRLDLSN